MKSRNKSKEVKIRSVQNFNDAASSISSDASGNPHELIIEYPTNCGTSSIISNDIYAGNSINKTDRLMTPYEYTKLWGVRAKQLKLGYSTTIKWEGRYDPIAIAKEEISRGEIPLMIKRRVPDSKYEGGVRFEFWDVKDMDIRDC